MEKQNDGVATPLYTREGLGVSLIKQDLRAMMNGVASAAMREAGMTADYRVNFGVELPRLQTLADEIKENSANFPEGEVPATGLKSLAQELWHERVRECRILALMLYPAEAFDGELADVWIDDVRTVELAQLAAFYLFSRMPLASVTAFQWIADEREIRQITGYYTLANLLRTAQLSERSAQELRDQAATALQSGNRQLVLAAQRALDRLPQ